jgi:hypothetical protein
LKPIQLHTSSQVKLSISESTWPDLTQNHPPNNTNLLPATVQALVASTSMITITP